ncbi:MAG: transglycosylase domain-containing protein [Proteobacteria bacterium]|nr:transglycosylase domain-containing protein [Pseudomonadota bacterium]
MKFYPFHKFSVFIFIFLGIFFIGTSIGLWIFYGSLPDVGFLSKQNASLEISVPDWRGRLESFTVGPANPYWTPLSEIPRYLKDAVLAGEDFSFYGHKGIDWFEVKESLKKNLKTRRFARGASTITQQLAKNLFLSREKTLARKFREILLAWKLEKALKKDRILELYLNIVELGDSIYGIGKGSRFHFNKEPADLSLREATILAAMLPGPKVYDPARYPDRVMNRSDHLLGIMLKGRMIREAEYLEALSEFPFAEETQSGAEMAPLPVPEETASAPSAIGSARTDAPYGSASKEPVPVPIPGYSGAAVEKHPGDLPGFAPPGPSLAPSPQGTPPSPGEGDPAVPVGSGPLPETGEAPP